VNPSLHYAGALRPVIPKRPSAALVLGVSVDEQKEATMTLKFIALVLLCLMTGTAMAQQAKVTPLMSKYLTENPGKEALMIMVEYPPARRTRSTDTMHKRLSTYWKGPL
jgi:hypothetical protein